MNVKLILLDDVEELGYAGDEVLVAPGYARNFLIPKGLAVRASSAALKQVAARKEKIDLHRKDELKKAQDVAAKIAEIEVTIPMQAGEDNQLFGSVTSHMISEEFSKHNINIESRRIELENPIKELGSYDVNIKVHKEVSVSVKVWVVRA